jgi:hypothetical protein
LKEDATSRRPATTAWSARRQVSCVLDGHGMMSGPHCGPPGKAAHTPHTDWDSIS